MGWNLADAFAGALQGFGSGVSMNAQSDIEAQKQSERARQQDEMDRRRADLDQKKAMAMAEFNNKLGAPDRKIQQDFEGRRVKATEDATASTIGYHRSQIDNTAEKNRLTGMLGDAKNENDRIRAQAAADKAGGIGGAGAGGKPGKLDQTLTDAEKINLEAFKKREQDIKSIMDPKEREAERLNIKREQFGTFGAPQIRVNRDGTVEMQDRSGGYERFKSAADAQEKGFGSDDLTAQVEKVNKYLRQQKSDTSMKKSGASQDAASQNFAAGANADRSIRSLTDQPGTPSTATEKPKGFNLSDIATGGYVPPVDSPAGQRAARVQAAQATQQADAQGKAMGAESARAMVRQNYQSYSPEQAQQMLDAYGSMLTPAELSLLQQRIRMAK